MPELPEVETIKNELSPVVCGQRILKIEFLWAKTLLKPGADEFAAGVCGRLITRLSRRGKYLVFHLDNGSLLLVHLRMTGSFLYGAETDALPRHTRAVIRLDNGHCLYFIDPRKFGKFLLVNDRTSLNELGPEPLDDAFTPEVLGRLLSGHRAPIKSVLVDQSVMAGIGNMYADEALFCSRIHPLRPADSLTSEEVKRLHAAIQTVLRQGIASKGASIANYFRPNGEKGYAHQEFKVAHRQGAPCPDCGTPLQRIVVRQRGTCFCPCCQPSSADNG